MQTRQAFGQHRTWHRARAFALSALVSLARRTVTGVLCTEGRQFSDWSADYRLFGDERFDANTIFAVVRSTIQKSLGAETPLVVAMDDSFLPKTGTKIHGVAYRRDPLGPPFHVNFIRAQRVLQLSAALPHGRMPAPARMVPIDFSHAPTPTKPRKNLTPQVWQEYRQAQRQANISTKGVLRLHALRQAMDRDHHGAHQPLWVVVDGRFTNSTVLRNLPQRTTLVGRVRKDAKFYLLPEPQHHLPRGRKRLYGDLAPTPEQLRQDPTIPWKKVTVWAAGKRHAFRVKRLPNLLWRTAGATSPLQLVIIAPLAYRPRKNGRLLYRQPAYLICTDPTLPLQQILQAYVWRWDIEVNYRDEKHLLGVGEAQVRKPTSVETLPALLVASYAMLLLAAHQTFGPTDILDTLPPPKWRHNQTKHRASTQDLINHLRAELWARAIGTCNFSGFSSWPLQTRTLKNSYPHLPSALFYMTQ